MVGVIESISHDFWLSTKSWWNQLNGMVLYEKDSTSATVVIYDLARYCYNVKYYPSDGSGSDYI